MPRPSRRLNLTTKLGEFALELRALRDAAPAQVQVASDGTRRAHARQPTIDAVAANHGLSRSTIYAALSGSRLPSRDTLIALIAEWTPNTSEDRKYWMSRRREVEVALEPNVASGKQAGAEEVDDDEDPLTEAAYPTREVHQAAGERLSQLLSRFCKKRLITQALVARKTNYSQAYVSRVMTGKRVPSLAFLNAFGGSFTIDPVEWREMVDLFAHAGGPADDLDSDYVIALSEVTDNPAALPKDSSDTATRGEVTFITREDLPPPRPRPIPRYR